MISISPHKLIIAIIKSSLKYLLIVHRFEIYNLMFLDRIFCAKMTKVWEYLYTLYRQFSSAASWAKGLEQMK